MSRGRIIGLLSGKGGVGKTSIGVNLSIALAEMDKEVTLVDTDFAASNLGVHLGKYDHPVKMQQVLRGDADPDSAIFQHPTGIKAAVSSNEIDQVEPGTANLRQTLVEASKDSDYVLVDCPPGLDTTVEAIMASVDELMIVTIPTQSAGINAAQIIEKAKQLKKPVLGTVVNMVEGDPEKELIEREIEMMTESHIIEQIPHEPLMKESLFNNTPLLLYEPFSEASLKIKEIAASIDGESYERPKFAKFKKKMNDIKRTFG
ncbi:MAG: P-loop NTPase [Candidatus Nanosalina sp.]